MSTRALMGHYTEDGAWRAVWVHVDGAPEDLGARLARAVELHGGDPRSVLAHVFSTKGWWSWPADPHHPADPDDVIFTPENLTDDFHWLEIALAQAMEIDEDFAVGDDFGKIVTRAHMVWRWLFDQAWEAGRGVTGA